jgi:hypothetical protein
MTKFSDQQSLYAEHGIVTFPVTEEKRPAVRGYLKLGPKASREMASKMASAPAIGFATNRRNRITVLDVDTGSEMVLADSTGTDTHR